MSDVKSYKKSLPENIVYNKRIQLVKKNLEEKFNLKLSNKQLPIISICSSGGGFRSMLATTGFLAGFEKINLLDSVMYLSTISGSSWSVIPWMLYGTTIKDYQYVLNKNLDNLYKLKKISNMNFNKLKSIKNLIIQTYQALSDSKFIKKKANKDFSFVDWYGILLANILLAQFGQKRFTYNLSDLKSKIEAGNMPIPFFSVISQFDNYKYGFVELSPFFIGSSYLDSYIKAEDFGKKFVNGRLILDYQYEEKLSFILGILGSAFSGSLKDLVNRIGILPIQKDLQKLVLKTEDTISKYSWGNKKLTAAFVNNFTFGMKSSPIKDLKKIVLFDAGYLCNLAIEPILNKRRKSDIIILLDNTKMMTNVSALKQVENLVKQYRTKFPNIDYKKAKTQTISIFKNKDLNTPIVVYIRLKKDESYLKNFDPQASRFCSTTNFFYSEKEANTLSGLTEHIITKNKDLFFDLIKDVLNR